MRVTVLRDELPIRYINLDANTEIDETRSESDPPFFIVQAEDPDKKVSTVKPAVST